MKLYALWFLMEIIIFINYSPSYAFKCGTHLIKKKPFKIGNDKVNNNKRKLSNEFTPIQIKIDYTLLSTQISSSNLNFYKEIFSDITNYFNSLLSVQHIDVDIDETMINEYCDIDKIGNGVERWLYDNDLIIFPYIDYTYDEEVLAAASACLVLNDYKPKGGIVGINNNFSNNKRDSKPFMEMLLMHELSHVLAFHPVFFDSLNLMITEEIDGNNYTFINSPKVIEKAKIHFNCSEIKGIQLEDQGGEGSVGAHWEARYMLGDYMISSDYTEIVISDITLALFEDTGFYKVNYYTGGLFRFGKNQGCSFLNEKCIKSEDNSVMTSFPNDFCIKSGKYFCGSSHISRGQCRMTQYGEDIEKKYQYFNNSRIGGLFISADYCPTSYLTLTNYIFNDYYYPDHCSYGYPLYSSNGEIIGRNSLCFESSLIPLNEAGSPNEKSICYEIECDKFKKNIIVTIGTLKVVCPRNRETLSNPDGFKGEIVCPDYNLVCSSEIPCNNMLDCIEKKSTAIRSTYVYLFDYSLNNNFYFIYLMLILYLL